MNTHLLSPQLGLSPNSILGGEVFDREILLGLAKKGVQVEIIIPRGKKYDHQIKNWRVSEIFISHAPAIFYNLFFLPKIIWFYYSRQIRIIRIHSPRYIGLGCLLVKLFLPKIKLIANFHQFRETNFFFLSKIVNRSWDQIICDSENVKQRLITNFQIAEEKITVVHNGVPDFLHPINKDAQLVNRYRIGTAKVLLFMGLFIERKNPLFLIDVLVKLHSQGEDVVILFLGKGALKEQIIKHAKEVGVGDCIRILEPVFGEEKNKIHAISDVFVHPSVDEGFALAPLEAMACGKPVVMNQGYSAAEAIIDGQTGYIARAGDVEDWTNKLCLLLNQRLLREKMGQAALQRVNKEFRWEVAIEKHLPVLNKLNAQ